MLTAEMATLGADGSCKGDFILDLVLSLTAGSRFRGLGFPVSGFGGTSGFWDSEELSSC